MSNKNPDFKYDENSINWPIYKGCYIRFLSAKGNWMYGFANTYNSDNYSEGKIV